MNLKYLCDRLKNNPIFCIVFINDMSPAEVILAKIVEVPPPTGKINHVMSVGVCLALFV